MNPFIFYIGAALLVAVSILLIWETSPFSSVGASDYEKLKIRRLAGTVLFLAAGLAFVVGLVTQLTLANP